MRSVAEKLGCTVEALRRWVRQALLRDPNDKKKRRLLLGRAMGCILSQNEPSDKPGAIHREPTMNHRAECAAILLEFGADPSPKDVHGETPLTWAKHGLADIAGFLKARGAA